MENALTLVSASQGKERDCFFAFCGYSKTEAGHRFGPAMRDVFVIHIVLEGQGFYALGNQRYYLRQGQGFVVPPGQSTFYQADEEEPWSYIWMGIGGDLLPGYLQAMGLREGNWSFEITSTQECKSLVFESLAYEGGGLSNELALQRQVYRFLEMLAGRLLRQAPKVQTHRVNPYVQQALDLIQEQVHEGLTVQSLARQLAISPAYLSRLFKTDMKRTVQEYIRDLRLNLAADLLISSNLSVEEIALKTGFVGSQSFSKAFRQVRGQSPTAFRQASRRLGKISDLDK